MSRTPPKPPGDRPFVFLNAAVSADGKIATANRAVHSFGSPRDLRHLYELRATADAVMSGARTIEISDAALGNGGENFRRQRLKNGLTEYPLRIVVSGSGSISPAAKIFRSGTAPLIILTTQNAPRSRVKRLQNLAHEVKMFGTKELDFAAALRWLHQKWNVRRLLCEGGGEVNDALFRADLVDEIHLTFCPKIFGGREAPTLADGLGEARLANAKRFQLTAFRRQKAELFTVFSRQPKSAGPARV